MRSPTPREFPGPTMNAVCRTLLVLAFAVGSEQISGQSFYYVEPGVAACPPAPAPTSASPKPVSPGVPMSGSISVACGLDKGSYTVILSSTDPEATFSPKTFLVNFGRIVGTGVYTVTFSTVGVQTVSATITPNMGSPAVRGQFVSPASRFEVVNR